MHHIIRMLDKNFDRIKTNSANWIDPIVWAVKIDSLTEGVFIVLSDNNEFILLYRTEVGEETYIEELDVLRDGDKLRPFVNCIQSLIKL